MIDVRIAGAAYAVPPETETVVDVLKRERCRVDAVLAPLSEASRRRREGWAWHGCEFADRAVPTNWFEKPPRAHSNRPLWRRAAWT